MTSIFFQDTELLGVPLNCLEIWVLDTLKISLWLLYKGWILSKQLDAQEGGRLCIPVSEFGGFFSYLVKRMTDASLCILSYVEGRGWLVFLCCSLSPYLRPSLAGAGCHIALCTFSTAVVKLKQAMFHRKSRRVVIPSLRLTTCSLPSAG